jgi:predicted naringenin-chalcone synthase
LFVTGIGTAVPATCYSQKQCWEALRGAPQFGALAAASRVLLERVLLGEQGVRTRHLALERIEEAFEVNPDVLHRRFLAHAPQLAARAAHLALQRSQVAPPDVEALLISTCTGYLCPGLTSYVGERLGLRSGTLLLDLVGQGCGAALPNLRTAEALVASGRCARVLSVCVEVCSAALYIDDDPGVLISACLFGDGAAAALLTGAPRPGERRVEWMGSVSLSDPGEREALRMEQRGGLLRNILSRRVPELAAARASEVLAQGLRRQGLSQEAVRAWIWHAGGRTVLERLRAATGLAERDTRRSADILERFGNLSSPFVLFVLEAALAGREPGGWWWMSSFGAGFSCHGAFLRVSD